MKVEFLPSEKWDVKILIGYMSLSKEFLKLEKEDQEVLVWALLKQPKETNELISMWEDEYQDKFSTKIESSELQVHSNNAIAFLKNCPLNIRQLVSTPIRLKAYLSISNLDHSFSIDQAFEHVKTKGFEMSEATVQILVKSLCYRGILRAFDVKHGGRGQPITFYQKIGNKTDSVAISDTPENARKKTGVLKIDSIEARNLLKFMRGCIPFRQLDKEDQCILVLSILKHPSTTEYLIDSWGKDYAKKSGQFDAMALQTYAKEAIVLCGDELEESKQPTSAQRLRINKVLNIPMQKQ